MLRSIALALVALAGSVAVAEDGKWFLSMHTGRSVVWIGGEDEREAFAMGIGYSRPDPKMKAGTRPGNLDLYVYFERSWSTPQDDVPHVASDAIGLIAAASWEDMWTKEVGTYFRVGWGLQVQNRTSNDLESLVNSSPTLGFGLIFRSGGELRIGVDYLHLSNGGTVGRNLGQNQLMVSLAFRIR
jgi:CubicO group peptidase (beta-lactamase class C family)